jgi:4-coumarate--CoA ligase
LIKVKGNQVAPAELEALLLDHPAVADAGVVGVTMYVSRTQYWDSMLTISRKGEELPRAYLVRRADQKVEAQDIQEFMNSKVAKHKRLAGGVVFVEAIPKNPVSASWLCSVRHRLTWKQSGKILRKILRDQAKAEVGDSEAKAARL